MIDWNKPIRTKSGKPAKLVHEMQTSSLFCMVVITDVGGDEEVDTYRMDGSFSLRSSSTLDLENYEEGDND